MIPATSATGSTIRRRRGYAIAGFTLLELMVVLAILAMVSTLLPIALDRAVPRRRADAAALELLSAVRSAQASAASSGQVYEIAPTEHGASVKVRGATVAAEKLSINWADSVYWVSSGDTTRLPRAVTLYPDGSSSGGVFALETGRYVAEVTVSALTGRVRLTNARSRS